MFGPLVLLFECIYLSGAGYVDQIHLAKGSTADFGPNDVLAADFDISQIHLFKFSFNFYLIIFVI